MSLLLDALQKAEHARAAVSEKSGAAPSSLAAPAGEPRSPTSLPDLPSDLALLDEQFISAAREKKQPEEKPAGPAAARPPLSTEGLIASHEAAKLLFAAKTSADGPRPVFVTFVGIATTIALLGIGIYFWWNLQRKGDLVLLPTPPTSSVTREASSATPASSAPATPSPTPSARMTAARPAAAADSPLPGSGLETGASTSFAPLLGSAAPLAPSLSSPTQPARPASPFLPPPPTGVASEATSGGHLAHEEETRVESLLEQAWLGYQHGEYERARVFWEKALLSDPQSLPALHGLAAIAWRHGQAERVVDYYRRALEIDPHDGYALTGLIALGQDVALGITPGRLKALLAARPDAAELHFALGNLLAAEGRWAEAQRAYHDAQRLAPGNPDYVFNLAVSLDRLHQGRAAIAHYRRALEMAGSRPASFDRDAALARLTALESAQP